MKRNDEEIDQLIRQAFSEEEAKFYDELEEQNIAQMVGGLLQGKMRWLNILTFVMMFILFGAAVYCGFQFYHAVEMKEMFVWGGGAAFLIMAVSFLKLYHLHQMDKNAILREIKRLELQVAMLNGKLEKK